MTFNFTELRDKKMEVLLAHDGWIGLHGIGRFASEVPDRATATSKVVHNIPEHLAMQRYRSSTQVCLGRYSPENIRHLCRSRRCGSLQTGKILLCMLIYVPLR